MLPGTVKNTDTLYPLAWSFWENAQLHTDEEIRTYTPKRVAGMHALSQSVLNMEAEDGLVERRWKIFSVFFRLGMAQEIAYYLESEHLANTDCSYYNFHEAPTRVKRETKDHILYQVIYGFKKAFPQHGPLIRTIMARSS